MHFFKFLLLFIVILLSVDTVHAQDHEQKRSWADVERFREDNQRIAADSSHEKRIVFMGNSITIGWNRQYPEYFEEKGYINRGISAQTTAHMLIRFRPDVIDLHPELVVILAGTNDIAGKIGPSTLKMVMDNIISMVELAQANGIKEILCSVLPAYDYPWNPGVYPADKIIALNHMIRDYTEKQNIVYIDYYSAMADERKGLKDEYTYDGVHPNRSGYKVMEPLTEAAIGKVLNN